MSMVHNGSFLKYGGLSIENNCNIHLSSGKELIEGTG